MPLTIEQQVINSLERNNHGILIELTISESRAGIKAAWNRFRSWLVDMNHGAMPEHIVAHEYHGFYRSAVCTVVFMVGITVEAVKDAARDAGFASVYMIEPLKRTFGRKKQLLKFFERCEMGVA